jgi:hypothetical protein
VLACGDGCDDLHDGRCGDGHDYRWRYWRRHEAVSCAARCVLSLSVSVNVPDTCYFCSMMTGENFFVTRFPYHGSEKGHVALGTSFPSKIVHLRLSDFLGESIICQKGAFLCGSDTVNIEMVRTCSDVLLHIYYDSALTSLLTVLAGVCQEIWCWLLRR